MNPYIATVLTFAIALAFLRLMDFFAHRGWIDGKLSRKLIHIGTGPIFVLCWLMFPDVPVSRWLAALVPMLITVQFALVGLGVVKDEASVEAMSRTGDRREILRGPLFYGVMFILMTVIYWKDSPIGITYFIFKIVLAIYFDDFTRMPCKKVCFAWLTFWQRIAVWIYFEISILICIALFLQSKKKIYKIFKNTATGGPLG